MQYPRHDLPSGPLLIRGHFCLHNQDESKRNIQPVHSHPISLVGDGASKFQ